MCWTLDDSGLDIFFVGLLVGVVGVGKSLSNMAASSAADLLHAYDTKAKALSASIVQLQELIDEASASFELPDEGDLSYGLLSGTLVFIVLRIVATAAASNRYG
jgi:hypothetical protein